MQAASTRHAWQEYVISANSYAAVVAPCYPCQPRACPRPYAQRDTCCIAGHGRCQACHQSCFCSQSCAEAASSCPWGHSAAVCKALAAAAALPGLDAEQHNLLRFLIHAYAMRSAAGSDPGEHCCRQSSQHPIHMHRNSRHLQPAAPPCIPSHAAGRGAPMRSSMRLLYQWCSSMRLLYQMCKRSS